MSRPQILVTGGAGYVGSHTVVELFERNYQPIILDNFVNSHPDVISGIERIVGQKVKYYHLDCCNESELQALFEENDIQGIIHFAAHKAVGESIREPIKYYDNNIKGLLSLLKVASRFNCPDIVFSSSCTVYGTPDSLPVSEDVPIEKAESPYGTTKIMGEHIISDFVSSNDCRAVSLRYFNPVGAHPTAEIGELPHGTPENLVPYITQTAAGLRDKLVVFGDDYNTPDGSCVRDYIHVMDLANAHVRALTYMADRTDSGYHDVFNIGTGQGHTVLELVKLFMETTETSLNYEIGPRRPGDVEAIYANCGLAEQKLGWTSKLSLEKALADAWAWQKKLNEK